MEDPPQLLDHNLIEKFCGDIKHTVSKTKPTHAEELLKVVKQKHRVVYHVFPFMKHLSYHSDLQRFQRSPENRTSLYQLVELCKSLALMLLPQQMMAEEIITLKVLSFFKKYSLLCSFL
ncbi:hypothetical protein CHARACLAT_033168 [Characodon lateralis]|uniref:Uncharacterized protein n=1 Tax=Characodon lateralis TaxID=208331 RepID=A0ABU7EZ64_9TELE|nr:hypothetical protein [Characodon lateralis]